MKPGLAKGLRSVRVRMGRDFHITRFAEDSQTQAYERVLAVALEGKKNPDAAPDARGLEPVYHGGEAA